MLTAITRDVGPDLAHCELTHLARQPIDVARAVQQHAAYKEALCRAGARVVELPALAGYPDAVFVEDTAVVLPALAVLGRMGTPRRQGEGETVAAVLAGFRQQVAIRPPATLEGGDVLILGNTLYVGLLSRTNAEGVQQLARLVEPEGFRIVAVPLRDCLHLKSACTDVGRNTLLVNRDWLDVGDLPGELLDVDPREPFAANTRLVGNTLLFSASYPHTRRRLEQKGFAVHCLDISELEKAEAGLTCMSLVFES